MEHKGVDIAADIARFAELGVLDALLFDRSTGKNIVWASSALKRRGAGYWERDEIQAWTITGANAGAVRTRAEKAREERAALTKAHAEVFTPTWVCKQMIDYADDAWWESLYCQECLPTCHSERSEESPSLQVGEGGIGRDISHQDNEGNSEEPPWLDKEWQLQHWQEYAASPRLEITCGEAPFLVNRYDADTGEIVPPEQRTGILGRKLALVGQASNNRKEWMKWAAVALQSIYGYELLGNSLLIARINALCSVEEFALSAGYAPLKRGEYEQFAEIISWNLWQMDGLASCVPFGTAQDEPPQDRLPGFDDLFATPQEAEEATPGRGAAFIFDWKNNAALEFRELKQKGTTMKFDYIIGNPPYQEEQEGDNKNFAPPIYHLFMDNAFEISDVVELIHPARFLFNAGSTPKVWNQKMLNDSHFKVIRYEADSSRIFPAQDIKGGIAITYRDARKEFGAIRTFTAFPELTTIFKKAGCEEESKSLASIIFTQVRYNLEALFKDYPELKDAIGSNGKDRRFRNNAFDKIHIFNDSGGKNSIRVIGIQNNKRTWKYIQNQYVDFNHDNLEKWKVLVPRANGSGALGEVLSTPLIGEPLIGYTQSFIGIGAFDAEGEAQACMKYVKGKFARVLLGILKITQDNDRGVWKYIPLQDFSSTSDIDWSQSVADVDHQLYKKYGLSKQEIEFIETHVKEMD